MTTLSDFFTIRNKGRVRGHREMGIKALGISPDHWDRNKDKPIRQLGLVWALALAALLYGLKPYWGDGK